MQLWASAGEEKPGINPRLEIWTKQKFLENLKPAV